MATTPMQNAFWLAPQKFAQVINPLNWLASGTGQCTAFSVCAVWRNRALA